MAKKAYPAHPEVPISKAIRAGDFVFTSAYGPWTFDPTKVSTMQRATSSTTAPGDKDVPFDEQVHLTFGFIREALAVAGCTLDDVVDCQCWLADARDFVRFNEIYRTYFTKDPPVRSVFPASFMFDVKVELKVIAYKPLAASTHAGRVVGRPPL